MIKLCMVRHGNTDWNAQHRIQGWTDVDLNDCGIEQANEAAEKIKQYQPFDLIITSDLLRAAHTAEIISDGLDVPLIKNRDIRERKHGILEGRTGDEIRDEYPGLNLFSAVDGRETMKEFIRRIQVFLKYINDEYDGKSLIVVTHGGVLKVLYSYFIKEEYEYWKNGEVRLFVFENNTMQMINE